MQKLITQILLLLMLSISIAACNRGKSVEVKPVQFATFTIEGLDNQEEARQLRSKLMANPGITSTAVNLKSNLVAVTYHADMMNDRKIKFLLDQEPGLLVQPISIQAKPNRPTCPVKKVRNWLSFK